MMTGKRIYVTAAAEKEECQRMLDIWNVGTSFVCLSRASSVLVIRSAVRDA